MAINLVARLSLQDNMTGRLSRVNAQLERTSRHANRVTSSIGSMGVKMAGFVGFAGVAIGLKESVTRMADFDSAIRKAGAIAGANTQELTAMSDAAKELGRTTSMTAGSTAEAMTELAAKGFDANQVIGAMPGIIKAAEASGEDLALTSDTIASALNIWKLKAEESSHVADVLAMAANKTAAGITDMQYAFKYAGAPAKALGMSLEEVSAAIGLVTNAGIDGSTAGTSLRAGLAALTQPHEKQQKLMNKVGFSAYTATGKIKNMVEIVKSLKDATKGMDKGSKVGFIKSVVGTESMSTFLSLVDAGPKKLAKLQKALEQSDGEAARASKKMKAGIGGALERASSAIDGFMIKVGDQFAPAVMEMAETIAKMDTKPFVDALGKIGDKAKDVATYIIENWGLIKETVITAGTAFVTFKAGMLGMSVILKVAAMMDVYKKAQVGATAATAFFNGVLLANPVGLVVVAIAGLIAIIVTLVRNWDTVKKKTLEFWDAIGGAKGAIRAATGPIGILIGAAIDLAKNWDKSKSVWENVWGAIKRSAAESVNSVIGGINEMIRAINKLPGVNVPIIAKVDWGSEPSTMPAKALNKKAPKLGNLVNYAPKPSVTKATQTVAGTAKPTPNLNLGYSLPGHKGGLARVPRDNYVANLHEGERVLTKAQNDAYSSGAGGVHVSFAGANFVVQKENDIEAIARALAKEIHAAAKGGA